MVQTSLAHGLIDEHLDILQWKKEAIEKSLVDDNDTEDTDDRLERILEQRKKMLRTVSFD